MRVAPGAAGASDVERDGHRSVTRVESRYEQAQGVQRDLWVSRTPAARDPGVATRARAKAAASRGSHAASARVRGLDVEDDRHRPVVDELALHLRAVHT